MMSQIDGLDLLIGRLAAKNSLLDDDLDTALSKWQAAAGDTAEGFGDYLVSSGQLSPEVLESLKRIANTLSDKWSEEGTLHELTGVVTQVETQSPSTQVDRSIANRPVPPTRSFGRFEIRSEHARGGLGKVFVARDRELNRNVALKQIRQQYAQDERLRERFKIEAEVTGRLEHPGVVPVYGLGVDEDGRPYYAMRFIQGESLGAAIKLLHSGKMESDEREIAFRKLLNNFVSVCYTLEFAHNRGVIHRDLKPDNIMLGAFGESLVVDWGIAKVVASPDGESSGSSELESLSDSVAKAGTLLGAVIGTPGFMSPEQGLGWHDALTPRSDVFSLGVILFQLLTGKMPVNESSSANETIQKMIQGEYPPPRQIDSSIPRDLDAICARAMHNNAKDRYGSARELANDIEAYLADRPVSARRESWLERAARMTRKYRSAFMIAGLSLIALTIISGGAAILINAQKKVAQTERDTATKLAGEKQALAEAEQASRQDAEAATERAEDVLGFLVNVLQSPDPERDGRTTTIVEVLDRVMKTPDRMFPDDPLGKGKLLAAIAETYQNLSVYDNALTAIELAVTTLTDAVGADHVDTIQALEIKANVLVALGRADEALIILKKLTDTTRAIDEPELLSTVLSNLGNAYLSRGLSEQAIPYIEEAHALVEANFPPEHFRQIASTNNLAYAYMKAGQVKRAITMHQAAQQLLSDQYGPSHPNTLMSLNNLGLAYNQDEQFDKAATVFEEVLRRRRETLGPDHHHTLRTEHAVAVIMWRNGQTERALPYYESSTAGLEQDRGSDHPDVLTMKANYGLALATIDRLEEAYSLFSEALSGMESRFEPSNTFYHDITLELAYVESRLGDYDASMNTAQRYLEMLDTFEPDNQSGRLEVVVLAITNLVAQGETDSALALIEEAEEMFATEEDWQVSALVALNRADFSLHKLRLLADEIPDEARELLALCQRAMIAINDAPENIRPSMRFRIPQVENRLKALTQTLQADADSQE